jgi:hypothetical protein
MKPQDRLRRPLTQRRGVRVDHASGWRKVAPPCVATDASMRRHRRLHAPARDSTCLAGACAVSRERQSWRASRPRGRPARADHRRACCGERHPPSRHQSLVSLNPSSSFAIQGVNPWPRRSEGRGRTSMPVGGLRPAFAGVPNHRDRGMVHGRKSPERRASEEIPRLPSRASHRRHPGRCFGLPL